MKNANDSLPDTENSAALAGKVLNGRCEYVHDGDSFRLAIEGSGEVLRVRLYGIDAPEKGQPYAGQSRRLLEKLIGGRRVRVEVVELDRYGRCVARVYGRDVYVNIEMLKAGLAWHYSYHACAAKNAELSQAAADAKKNGLGLWAGGAPVSPRKFRCVNGTVHEKSMKKRRYSAESKPSGIKKQQGLVLCIALAIGAAVLSYVTRESPPPEAEIATLRPGRTAPGSSHKYKPQTVKRQARAMAGLCEYVHDGDTLSFIPDGDSREVRVRLHGVDAPEKGQAFADEARQWLRSQAQGKQIRLQVKDMDQYGRYVARVYVGECCLNSEILQQGLAMRYEKYCDPEEDADLTTAETAARHARRGLWGDDDFINPREHRRRYGTVHDNR